MLELRPAEHAVKRVALQQFQVARAEAMGRRETDISWAGSENRAVLGLKLGGPRSLCICVESAYDAPHHFVQESLHLSMRQIGPTKAAHERHPRQLQQESAGGHGHTGGQEAKRATQTATAVHL